MTEKKPATKKKKMGAPSKYTEALARKICDLIAQGKSEAKISKMAGMPSEATITRWKESHPDFCDLSARARAKSAARFREQALDAAIALGKRAEDALEGHFEVDGGKVIELPKSYVEAKKVLIQELNREAALRDDANFGDRKKVTVDGGLNVKQEETFDLSGMSTEDLEKLDELLKNAQTA